MKQGIYNNIPFDEYLKIEAMSATSLKALSLSYRDWERLKDRKYTKTLQFGSLAHSAVLEPELLEQAVILPEKRINDKGQEVKFVRNPNSKYWKEFLQENEGKEIITSTDFNNAKNIVSSIHENTTAKRFLEGDHEVTLVWDDPVFGKGKARCDTISDKWISDLKTTQDISPRGFGWNCFKYRYDIQAAWYLYGAEKIGLSIEKFYFIPIETNPPHDSSVLLADKAMIENGERGISEAIQNMKSGNREGYHGKFPGVHAVEFPVFEEEPEITLEMSC